MNNYKLGSPGDLFYCNVTESPPLSSYPFSLGHNLVMLKSSGWAYASVSSIAFIGKDVIPTCSVDLVHLKLVKSGFAPEDTKIEIEKPKEEVLNLEEGLAIVLENLYVDDRLIAKKLLIGDEKMWKCWLS